jgi:hypothetical protein
MRKEGPHCLSPDLSGRVCGTAAGNRCARVAGGQVEGGLSFASFSFAVKENEGDQAEKELDRINRIYRIYFVAPATA